MGVDPKWPEGVVEVKDEEGWEGGAVCEDAGDGGSSRGGGCYGAEG